MRRNLIPILLTCIVLVISGILLFQIISKSTFFSNSDKMQNLINLFLACFASISAIYVVYSYVQTNSAFILSQRPSLLVQVESLHIQNPNNSNSSLPRTRIHYKNTTNNSFDDLSFNITVYTSSRTVDISDLFRREMKMPGFDTRQRTFDPIYELNSRGFNIIQEASQGNEVKLKISYTFTFLNKKEKIEAQEYKWNNNINEWEIY